MSSSTDDNKNKTTTTAGGTHNPTTTPPPGLEVLFKLSSPPLLTPFTSLLLPIHWSVIRANCKLISSNKNLTELLDDNWWDQIQIENGNRRLKLNYKNLNTGECFGVNVVEVVEGAHVAVAYVKEEVEDAPASGDNKEFGGGAVVFDTKDYLNLEVLKENPEAREEFGRVYKVDKLEGLEGIVVGRVLCNGVVKGVNCTPPSKSPYDSTLSDEKLEQMRQERLAREAQELKKIEEEEAKKREAEERAREDLLRIQPPRMPGMPNIRSPLGDYGRSDLDPFGGGGIGGGGIGGMLMDPRGFRRLPGPASGMIPPGARFDPFGPGVPDPFGGGFGGMPRRGGGGGGAPNLPFGYINPDHERVPDGLDDMFT